MLEIWYKSYSVNHFTGVASPESYTFLTDGYNGIRVSRFGTWICHDDTTTFHMNRSLYPQDYILVLWDAVPQEVFKALGPSTYLQLKKLAK